MPLYEYECDACGRRFERIQKFSDPLIDKCPTCGASAKRVPSSPAIQFKGSGFYITDYAKKGGEKSTGEDKPAKTAGSATESKGTDAKTTPAADAPKPAATTTGSDKKSSS